MAFRTQGMTGSNNIPLGNRRRFGGGAGSVGDDSSNSTPIDTYNQPQQSPPEDLKRGRTPVKGEYIYIPIYIICMHYSVWYSF